MKQITTDLKVESKDVYFVWQKNGHMPRVAHNNEGSALTEAARLARLNPGKKFLVLHALNKVSVNV